MHTKFVKKTVNCLVGVSLAASLSACMHDDDDDENMQSMNYQVEVYNLTSGQPLTPLAAILHKPGYAPWMLGASASVGMETIAESGDSSTLISEAESNMNYITSMTSSNGPFLPGSSESVTVTSENSDDLHLSLVSMLANTNDAFTGISNLNLENLEKGEKISLYMSAYDAGTEKNTESLGTLPGPADNGEGFNSTRDEYSSSEDYVSIHRGAVTVDDGLSSSVLNETHRWNGPVAKLVVTRLQ